MPAHLYALDDALLVHLLSFCAARDVEATTKASRVVALHLLPQYPEIWRVLFVRQWGKLNFKLDAVTEDARNLQIDSRLRELFPAECTETRMFQLLSRSVVPLPSGMDIGATQNSWGYSDTHHRIVPLEQEKGANQGNYSSVTTFAFDGKRFGNDRSVRANAPFPASFYVAVFKRRVQDKTSKKEMFVYQIGATESGYFEITISDPATRPSGHTTRNGRVEMTAIGLVPSTFPLVGKQPGWTIPSFGYHGDNGKLYSAFPVTPFLPGASRYIPCDNDQEWFPAVGLDSPDTIHVNFGQQPFKCDHVIGAFIECTGTNALVARQILQNANKSRFRAVRRNCIDAFIANVLERRRLTTT
ncbi:hypothetical protein PHYSODRAFT_468382 [Phytophthora sojae]|uniref:F-box domain-containing protein n=1 Tax=Phytophthora sojae (strain P6497) TaxID=1094619 RepID=G4YH47_PHYSP|nr:hypothetical protein PHYSODRAFT_468382 [Phytophthora sojae]EGZ28070.1 hypothetical protein PHYSODRAFT_468382 [Phytophthora sojae]|eukprot:XP_009515345.1 hypothetical protein PHYSODRAFT_468382 [Phytophthora sojae]